ncbi:MAG: Bax inhibitor-1/YccA family protein [Hyphomicrobiales bacterium]|nr:Bax inhibitor-1/YccA family protein [Hyphomicrobiales bacterium]MDE2115984.1 Bax inhibitor-1/YccA family protein [Hyphomicrobiales bacterium]
MSDYDRNATSRFGAAATRASSATLDQGLRSYMLGVYNYMASGLAITGLVAYAANMLGTTNVNGHMALTDFGRTIYVGPLHWLIILAPLGFVMFLSVGLNRMSAATARVSFYAFAAAMGLSTSILLLVYTSSSVANAFFVTAATFGALSLYGYTTTRSLSAMGSFLYMALIGLVIASVVNLFVHSGPFQYALSVISVLIFSGLTAWDTQAIKEMYMESDSTEMAAKKSINGALMLYLDFINIFQSLLMIFGDRR